MDTGSPREEVPGQPRGVTLERAVVVTGDRPTGRLHLGHLVGSLRSRVEMQDRHDCFFLIADLHVLTTHVDRLGDVEQNVFGIVMDWLSVGLDPSRSTFYVQSRVPEIPELATILAMLCPVPRAERIPTLKDTAADLGVGESYSVGLLAYPILMAADILMFNADVVPVGEDQLSHLELTRELARRFNHLYRPLFHEPEALVSRVPRLVGTDGRRKMSKSLGNAIYLSDNAETVAARVRRMYTDPRRIRADVPGRVEDNPVFVYHELFNDDRAEVEELEARYRRGAVGDVEVKDRLARALNRMLEPIRERRRRFEERPDDVRDILHDGTERAKAIAARNLAAVLDHMGLSVPC